MLRDIKIYAYISLYTMSAQRKAKALARFRRTQFGRLSRVDRSQNRRIRKLERGPEVKVLDLNQNFTSVGTTGQIANLSLLAQGDTNITRDGNKIQAKKLDIRLKLSKTVVTVDTLRIVIFVDKEQHGADPGLTDLMTTSAVDSFYNINQSQRFRILKDMTVVINADDTGVGADNVYRIFTINLRNMPIHYIGTAADDASCGKNNIYIFMVALEDTTKSVIRSFSRLYFQDP